MIQELLGDAGAIAGGRKIPINGGIVVATTASPSLPTSPCPSFTNSTVTSTTAPTGSSSNSETPNLRCPRCDSSNTKFCYYNNYNLTQPRHFCKTCRRYWTRGGALRNVPIGGGCRKNKNSNVSSSAAKAINTARMKTVVSEIERSGLVGGFDHDLTSSSSPILWGSPQDFHLLALLRSSQNNNPNPSHFPSTVTVKEEGNLIGNHMATDPLLVNNVTSIRIPGSDLVIEAPSHGLCGSSWRNSTQYQLQPLNGNPSDLQKNELQELYKRLRLSSSHHCPESEPLFESNPVFSSTMFESAPPLMGSEILGYGNQVISWPDIPAGATTHGAYP